MAHSSRRRAQHHFASDHAWARAFQEALDTTIGAPRDAALARPLISIIAVSQNGLKIEIGLRFERGSRYCCAEPGCFIPSFDRQWWSRVREHLRAVTEREPPPMTLEINGIVEDGALLRVLAGLGLPEESSGYSYRHGPCREREAG